MIESLDINKGNYLIYKYITETRKFIQFAPNIDYYIYRDNCKKGIIDDNVVDYEIDY